MRRAGIAVFCAAVSCEAFHFPVVTTSGWLSATRQQRACQTPAECHRRPRTALGMTAADGTAAQEETKVAVTASSGASAVDEGAAGDAAKAEGDPAVTTDVVAEKKKGGRGSKVRTGLHTRTQTSSGNGCAASTHASGCDTLERQCSRALTIIARMVSQATGISALLCAHSSGQPSICTHKVLNVPHSLLLVQATLLTRALLTAC